MFNRRKPVKNENINMCMKIVKTSSIRYETNIYERSGIQWTQIVQCACTAHLVYILHSIHHEKNENLLHFRRYFRIYTQENSRSSQNITISYDLIPYPRFWRLCVWYRTILHQTFYNAFERWFYDIISPL